jgi:tetratricopeptide (TPR) repeat protein
MWTAGKLTDVRVRLASPGTHGDGNGLYLVVRQGPVGLNRSWLFRYSVAGRSHWTGLGGYPDISLQRARQKAQECRQQLYEGIDPLKRKRDQRAALSRQADDRVRCREAAWQASGFNKVWLGEHQTALDRLTRAIRLSPSDFFLSLKYLGVSQAHFFLEQYDEAASWGERAYSLGSRFAPILRFTAAAYAMSGDLAKARAYGARAIEADPVFSTLSKTKDSVPLRRPQDLAKFEEALRLAGLPE